MTKKANASHNAEQFIRSQGYTYFAFICYQHQDAKWAVWLKRKLQSYRLPTKACERYRGLPRQISPIFLDKDNMKPGELSSHERDEVQSAKYLIVICSKNACRRSKNMDDEIRYFTEGGFDPSRIIPFIVDDAQRPEEECFPQLLQEICRYSNIIGANIHDSGKNSAVLKVVAHMLGIKLEELESEDKRRRKRRNIFRAVAAAVLVIALCVGGYFVWDYYIPKYSYFVDYTEVYGLPQGIGALSKQETESMHEHYTIISQYGKVQELRHENAYGNLNESMEIGKEDRPVRITYSYSPNGVLSDVIYYNVKDNPTVKWHYDDDNLKALDIKKVNDTDSGSYGGGQALASHSVHYMAEEDYGYSKNSNIIRLLIDYDENGYICEKRYASSTLNHVGTDADGISGIRYERDEKGRVVRESYLSFMGNGNTAVNPDDYEIIGTRNGIAYVEYEYNKDDCVRISFFDTKGQLTPGFMEVADFRIEFKNHNMVKESFFDVDGERKKMDGDYSSAEYDYDARGNVSETRFVGVDGDPVMLKAGYSICKTEVDDQGNVIETSFYDADDQMVMVEEGYALWKNEYDANGNLVRRCSYDIDGQPVINKFGYASYEIEYDEKGNAVKMSYYDTEGDLTMSSSGYAMCIYEFDEWGRERKRSFYGADEKPVFYQGEYVSYEKEYDEWGNTIRAVFFDAEGNYIMINDGYAIWESTYDERGNITSMRCLDTNEKPVKTAFGWAEIRTKYDERGNEVGKSYLGTNGELLVCQQGYAYYQCEFDVKGNETERTYYGTNRLPVIITDGYASYRCEYDAKGRITSLAYYGVNGERVMSNDGYSSCTWEYDERGEITNAVFYNNYGVPMITHGVSDSAETDEEEDEGSGDDSGDQSEDLPQRLYNKAIGFVTDLVTG